MVLMVRRASRSVRVLTCAALAFALVAVPSARCFADVAARAAKMACCAEMEQDCHHASVQQGCCALSAPDQGIPAVASRVDQGKAPTVGLPAVNALWRWPASPPLFSLPDDTVPKPSSRPTYLLVAAFRI
jgi:hypothetical protein